VLLLLTQAVAVAVSRGGRVQLVLNWATEIVLSIVKIDLVVLGVFILLLDGQMDTTKLIDHF
jgi:hypothetical protein